jgi:hypothetical protein
MSMTTETVTTRKQEVIQIIDTLSDDAIGKLASYAAFLRHETWLDEQEETEDIAYIEAHKDDPAVPFDIREYE